MRWLFVAMLLAGCSSDANLAQGQQCSSSDECGAGLLCDFGQMPHVCSPTSSAPRDMAVPMHDAEPDAHQEDLLQAD